MSSRPRRKTSSSSSFAKKKNDSILPMKKTPTTLKSKSKSTSRLCSVVGCTKQVQQGGVCCRHGAKTTRASCTADECTNVAKRGGLCRRHGAFDLETCAKGGCKRVVKEGQYCVIHKSHEKDTVSTTSSNTVAGKKKRGTKTSKRISERKTCSEWGCSYRAKKGGFCGRHCEDISDVGVGVEGAANNDILPTAITATDQGDILNHLDHQQGGYVMNNYPYAMEVGGGSWDGGSQPYVSDASSASVPDLPQPASVNSLGSATSMDSSVARSGGVALVSCTHLGCTSQAMEGGETCIEHCQFNFMGDIFEDMHEQFA